jgi:hypothetical protein
MSELDAQFRYLLAFSTVLSPSTHFLFARDGGMAPSFAILPRMPQSGLAGNALVRALWAKFKPRVTMYGNDALLSDSIEGPK